MRSRVDPRSPPGRRAGPAARASARCLADVSCAETASSSHAASNGDPHALLAELEAIGLREGVVSGNAVSGVLPFEALGALAIAVATSPLARPAMAHQ